MKELSFILKHVTEKQFRTFFKATKFIAAQLNFTLDLRGRWKNPSGFQIPNASVKR